MVISMRFCATAGAGKLQAATTVAPAPASAAPLIKERRSAAFALPTLAFVDLVISMFLPVSEFM
jgi:hypothetical protein